MRKYGLGDLDELTSLMLICCKEWPASAVGLIPGCTIQVSSKTTPGDSWLLARFRQCDLTRRHRLEGYEKPGIPPCECHLLFLVSSSVSVRKSRGVFLCV